MGFELPTDLESRVTRYAEEERMTTEEALRDLVETALRRKDTPARRMIGLFTSDEDAAIMDGAMAIIEEGRRFDTAREPLR